MTYRAAILAAALLSGMFATFSSSAQAADPVKIRVGWIVMPSNLAPILFAKAGIGRHNDKSYVLDPVYFSSSSAEITALATEQIDIAAMGFSTLPLAIENAGLKDLRLLADEVQDGNGSGFTLQFMVRRDSNINSVTDLKGKVLATIGIGTGAHTGMLATLQKFGLQDKRDYTVIETPFPTMKGMLKDGKADLIAVTTGFAADPELKSIARTLFTQKDGMGPSALSFWAARSGFIAKNRAALVDFLEDSVRSTRWYKDPANRKEAVEIVAKAIKAAAGAHCAVAVQRRSGFLPRSGFEDQFDGAAKQRRPAAEAWDHQNRHSGHAVLGCELAERGSGAAEMIRAA